MDDKYKNAKAIIQKQLNVVILNNRTKLMLNNDAFLKEVIKNISALKAIESLSNIDKTKMLCYKYLDRVNTAIKTKQDFIDYILPEIEIDLIDEIKFINSLSVNLFGEDLEAVKAMSLDSSKVLPFEEATANLKDNVSSESSQEATKSTQTNNGSPPNQEYKQNQSTNYNYGNPADYKESYIKQMAFQRLSSEIKSGKIFIYSHKPRAVPIIKYSVAAFYALLGFFNLGVVFFLVFLLASNATYTTYWNPDSKSYVNPSGYTPGELESFTKTDIFANIGSWTSYVFIVILMLMFFWISFSYIKGMKNNDNFKYTMKTFIISLLVFFGLIFLINNVQSSAWALLETIKAVHGEDVPGREIIFLEYYNILMILNMFSYSATILSIVFIIPYYIVRPKLNIQLQMELLRKYEDEIRSLNNF